MVSECQRVGLPPPEFHTNGNSVQVVFPTSTRQVPDKYPTSTRQVEILVKIIDENIYSVKEIMTLMELKDRESFMNIYLYPSMENNLVEPLYPEQPKHPKQKYRLTEKGKELLKILK
jgi:ATP-dependent DNA helicase RecG